MKYTHFITAALLTASISSASGFGLSFYQPVQRTGFDGFKPGMIWGVVVNTTPDSFDFSALENLNVGQLEQGVNTSGQWLNNSMLYLTGGDGSDNDASPLSVTTPIGTIMSLIGVSYNTIDANGDAYSIQPGSTFALIWFDISMRPKIPGDPIVPTANSSDRYGFLTVRDETGTNNGFRVPADGVNGTFYEHANRPLDRVDNLSFAAAAIPEPSTYALLLSGLVLGACVLRRRNRKAAA